MKRILFFGVLAAIFIIGSSTSIQAQSKKELKKHFKKIAKSKKKKSIVLSLDTMFYAGRPYCTMKKIESNDIQAKVTPTYEAYSLNGKGPLTLAIANLPSNPDGGPYYGFSYVQNGWKMSEYMEIFPLAIKKQLMGAIKSYSVFGALGNSFEPWMLNLMTMKKISTIKELSILIGTRDKEQDLTKPIILNLDKNTILRGEKVIGSYEYRGEGDEKMLGFRYSVGGNAFAVVKVPSTPGLITISEQDRKNTTHEMEVKNIDNLVQEIAEFLAAKELL